MPLRKITLRWASHLLAIVVIVVTMSAAVLGVIVWKAIETRKLALARSEIDTANLAHSLTEHINHSIKSVEMTMTGIVTLLKFQDPVRERMNQYLDKVTRALPQLQNIGVLNADGEWRFQSFADMGAGNNSDRGYFRYHRDNADPSLRINNPVVSRLTGKPVIPLSQRITTGDGSFAGVLVAAIDIGYLNSFYKSFNLGENGGITLILNTGIVMTHWPSVTFGRDLSDSTLFKQWLKTSTTGFYKVPSAFDGIIKFFAYEQSAEYPLLVTVSQPETNVLSQWRQDLRGDIWVAASLLLVVILLAGFLSAQFRYRARLETSAHEREVRYRLLADNIADIVVRVDDQGKFEFVSPSVKAVLGREPHDLVGTSCFDITHPDDVESVLNATKRFRNGATSVAVTFRIYRFDMQIVWVEINYRRVASAPQIRNSGFIGVMRDVTARKQMEGELMSLNQQLAQLASHDPMTGLANRRTLDSFLRSEFGRAPTISFLMIDIDNFKGFNDSMGHQAGDECLKQVAAVINQATVSTRCLSARYGGEEFALILPDVTMSGAHVIAESIRFKIRALRIRNPAAVRGLVSISIGVSSRTAATQNEVQLISDADVALYQAKHQGRDQTVLAQVPSPPLAPALSGTESGASVSPDMPVQT